MRPQHRPVAAARPTGTSRRTALAGLGAVAAGALLAACSGTADTGVRPGRTLSLDARPTDDDSTPSTTATPKPAEDSDPETDGPQAENPPTLPALSPWTPGPGEVQPEVKALAARLVELAGTWGLSEVGPEAAAQRLTAAGYDPALVPSLSRLLTQDGEAAVVAVRYPQYGGLTTTAASVMIALDQTLATPDGTTSARGMTLDVRLAPSPDGWSVVAIGPDQPPSGPGTATALGEAILANPRVLLPADAQADVQAGTVLDPVLAVLDGLSRDHTIEVLTFSTGHPVNVFGTARQSNHSRGRAVDIWRIDGALVIDPSTPRDLLAAVMTTAGQLGATEVGGPFDLNGERPQYFTDALHKDHLHIGVSEGRAPAVP